MPKITISPENKAVRKAANTNYPGIAIGGLYNTMFRFRAPFSLNDVIIRHVSLIVGYTGVKIADSPIGSIVSMSKRDRGAMRAYIPNAGYSLDAVTYANRTQTGSFAVSTTYDVAGNIYSSEVTQYQGRYLHIYSGTLDIDLTSILGSNLTANGTVFDLSWDNSDLLLSPDQELDDGPPFSGYPNGQYVILPSLEIEYDASEQLAPTPVTPKNAVIRANDPILFTWSWNGSGTATQKKVTIEYRKVNTVQSITLSLTQAGYAHTLSSGLAEGSYEWRIKAMNNLSVESGWSDWVVFNIVGSPAAPVIGTPVNKALTTISWNVRNQVAFEITLTDAEGNEIVNDIVVSAEPLYKPQFYLKGTYTVGVKVCGASGLWSDVAYKTFTIDGVVPSAVDVGLFSDEYAIGFRFNNRPGISVAVLRAARGDDFEVIAALDDTISEFVDDTAKSGVDYRYKLRFVGEGYSESPVMDARLDYGGAILSDDATIVHMQYSEEQFLPYKETYATDTAFNHYVGREFSVVEKGDFSDQRITRRFVVSENGYKDLCKLLKKPALKYRDNANSFKCAISDISVTHWMNDEYVIELSMERIHEGDVIVNV